MIAIRTVPRRALAATLLAALLAVGGAPPSGAAEPERGLGGGEQPSVTYLEAVAHEDDEPSFEPGGRVSVPFRPRAGDAWLVDGKAPRALPAGRASGSQMAATPNGLAWADLGPGERTGSGAGASPAEQGSPIGGDAADAADATDATDATAIAGAAGDRRRQVFGFLPHWELDDAPGQLNYDVLSTIAYFAVPASRTGDLKKRDADGRLTPGWAGWTSAAMTGVIDRAHQHGVRVVMSITSFAWNEEQANVQRSILGSKANRETLARQAAAAVRDRGADGINVDFEPVAAGYADEFLLLLEAMRDELNRLGPGYELTFDTTGYVGNYPIAEGVAPGRADAIFVMGYGYRSLDSQVAGSIDPLRGRRYDLTDTVRAYTAKVHPSRLILGLPWFGRTWPTVDDALRAETRSLHEKYGESDDVNYEAVVGLVEEHGRRWDEVEHSPYVVYRDRHCSDQFGCVDGWRQVYYDDRASLGVRLAMVNEYGLRGAGIWALGYDGGRADLYRAYADAFLVDKAGPAAGIERLAVTQGDEGFVVDWSARDASDVVAYDVQVAVGDGPWQAWLAATTATSEVYPGSDGTGYAFRVRARDARGNAGAWNVTSTWTDAPSLEAGGFARVVTDGLAVRGGPGKHASLLGRLDAGTLVALTTGPVVKATGAVWFEVTHPIREWGTVSFVERGVWAMHSDPDEEGEHLVPAHAPNSTRVAAGITGLSVGGPGAGDRTLSPNGDGRHDTLALRWTNEVALEAIEARVVRADGSVAGTFALGAGAAGAGEHAWTWDGTAGGDAGGAPVADGSYALQLVGIAAGATYHAPSVRPASAAQLDRFGVTVDTAPPVFATASVSQATFSPDGNGAADTTRVAFHAPGAATWTIRIEDGEGATVREASGSGPSASLDWDGTDGGATSVADGPYAAVLVARDAAGNEATRTLDLFVDTEGPAIVPTALPGRISPDGDRVADATRLAWTADEAGTGWVRVYRGETRVRAWTVDGGTGWSATWDGRAADGAPLPDGTYALRVRLTDAAGNTGTAEAPLVLDRTAGSLAWSRHLYPQDGDALRPTATLSWRLGRDATTTLEVLDADGALVRTAWASRPLAKGVRSWTWNGRDDAGALVPQGGYTARLTAVSWLGTTVLQRTVHAGAFAGLPRRATVAPGETLTLRFASVEPLDARPVVVFRQPGRKAVSVTATLRADGTYRVVLPVRDGPAGAGSVRIRAKDTAGGTNAVTVPVTVAP